MKRLRLQTSDDVLVATEDSDRYVRPANVPDVHTEVQQLCTAWQVKRPVRTPLDTSCWRYWLHGEQRRVNVTLISARVKHLHTHHDHCHYPDITLRYRGKKAKRIIKILSLTQSSIVWVSSGNLIVLQNSGSTYTTAAWLKITEMEITKKNLIPLTKSKTRTVKKNGKI